ncbi:MAG: hypothetical protein HZB32_08055 [Nitrospirae bacterium]|nr:hypothetical protein [Nitrospirota bacterium]
MTLSVTVFIEGGATLKEVAKVFNALSTSTEESPANIMSLLETLMEVLRIRKEIEAEKEAQVYLKHLYNGLETDFTPINAVLAWCGQVTAIDLISSIKEWLITPVARERLAVLRSTVLVLYEKWNEIDEIVNRIDQFGTLEVDKWLYDYKNTTQDIATTRLLTVLEHLEDLSAWAALSRTRYHADKLGLSAITVLALDGAINAEEVKTSFLYAFYNSIARTVLRHSRELMEFSGLSHDKVRGKFAELDREVIRLTGERYVHIVDQRPVPYGHTGPRVKDYTDEYLLIREIGKRNRHIPIRQLVRRAGSALQALKPCFMMGPLSVAQYLQPGMLEFDLIVMDEASQLRPEEAMGAIARGKQLVVVGDPKQLPPTTFFDRLLGDTDATEEEETALEGVESIRNICQTIYHPPRILCWHYRSRHESLIAFSNRHFYDDKLIVFPSPHGNNKGLGLRYHYITNAVYDNRRNHEEAKRVAECCY